MSRPIPRRSRKRSPTRTLNDPDEDPVEDPEEDPDEEPRRRRPEEEPDEEPELLDGPASPWVEGVPAVPAHAPGTNAARASPARKIPRFIKVGLRSKGGFAESVPIERGALFAHDPLR